MTDTLSILDPLLTQGVPDSRWTALLHHALRFGSPPPQRQVYVNRTLRLETIQHIGFDLDWTLADYKRLPIEKLTFELAIERLIEQGYPEELRQAEFRPDFPRRGLLIDKSYGTVLRMNRHRYVGRAYLGHRQLGRRETMRLYRQDPINTSSERFYHVDSLFELPETNLYSELVELSERHPSLGLPSYRQLFADTRAAIDWLHADGPLKQQILADIGTFLRPDEELGLALLRLALGGRKIILITNSPWHFAEPICSFLFDGLLPGLDSWRQLFDLVVVDSRKPDFFRKGRPFVELDSKGKPTAETDVPKWGGVYSGGSQDGLMKLLDCPGENVLYVGDHIYGDIVSSKLESTWRTALIVSELEDELRLSSDLAYEMGRLVELRHRLANLGHQMDRIHDVVNLYQKIASEDSVPPAVQQAIHSLFDDMKDQHRNVRLRVSRLSQRISDRFNPYWGSFFKQGSNKTLFASQLEAYSCLFTSRVSNFGFYGTNHYFRVVEDAMMFEGDRT